MYPTQLEILFSIKLAYHNAPTKVDFHVILSQPTLDTPLMGQIFYFIKSYFSDQKCIIYRNISSAFIRVYGEIYNHGLKHTRIGVSISSVFLSLHVRQK